VINILVYEFIKKENILKIFNKVYNDAKMLKLKCCSCFNFIRNNNKINTLKNSSNSIPEFSLKGFNTIAKIVDVYDGDTSKAVFYLDNKLTKFTIRMIGYDTTEIRTNDPIEKIYGFSAKIIVQNMILNKLVYLKCYGWDKYGRLLADIYMKSSKDIICLNDWIIQNNLGVKYDGKTKNKFIAYYGNDITENDIINKINIPHIDDINDYNFNIL